MGRMKIRPDKKTREMVKLAKRIESAQELAVITSQIENPVVRQAVINRIKPFLKFKLEGELSV